MKTLKEQVIGIVRSHRLWLYQKCKITNEALYPEIATHFFVMVAGLGLIPRASSHVSPILKVENGREKLVNFTVNRYFLTAVMDWALRRGTCNNAICKQYKNALPAIAWNAFVKTNKYMPTEFQHDQTMGISLEVAFGAIEDFFPFVQRGELIRMKNTIQVSHSGKSDKEPVRYREFYSPEIDRQFYAKESAESEWGNNSAWRIINTHIQGFPVMGGTRGFCLPRLACTIAASRLVELDLGRKPDHEDELIGESLDSLKSRDDHEEYHGFPWEAFLQQSTRKSFERVIRVEINYPDDTIQQKADRVGMAYKSYVECRDRCFEKAQEWYQAGGLDLS